MQGQPDHGAMWTAQWQAVGGTEQAATDGFRLSRRVKERSGAVDVDYEITSLRGEPLVHAVHLLLNASDAARLEVAGSPAVTWRDRNGPGRHQLGEWPRLDGVDFSGWGPMTGRPRAWCCTASTSAASSTAPTPSGSPGN